MEKELQNINSQIYKIKKIINPFDDLNENQRFNLQLQEPEYYDELKDEYDNGLLEIKKLKKKKAQIIEQIEKNNNYDNTPPDLLTPALKYMGHSELPKHISKHEYITSALKKRNIDLIRNKGPYSVNINGNEYYITGDELLNGKLVNGAIITCLQPYDEIWNAGFDNDYPIMHTSVNPFNSDLLNLTFNEQNITPITKQNNELDIKHTEDTENTDCTEYITPTTKQINEHDINNECKITCDKQDNFKEDLIYDFGYQFSNDKKNNHNTLNYLFVVSCDELILGVFDNYHDALKIEDTDFVVSNNLNIGVTKVKLNKSLVN